MNAPDLSNLPCWDGAENIRRNILSALGRGLPLLAPEEPHGRKLGVVAFGPSLIDQEQDIAAFREQHEVWCVNSAHDWLCDRLLKPDACVLLDSTPDLADVVTPEPGVRYLLASQCHPRVFDRLKAHDVTLWHAWVPKASSVEDIRDMVTERGQPGQRHWFISGGGTAALRALMLGKFLGYRHIEAFGLDSSFVVDRKHAVEPHGCVGNECEVDYAGRTFQTNTPLAAQAQNFIDQYQRSLNDVRLYCHGDGLIPHICRHLNELKYGTKPSKSRSNHG